MFLYIIGANMENLFFYKGQLIITIYRGTRTETRQYVMSVVVTGDWGSRGISPVVSGVPEANSWVCVIIQEIHDTTYSY